MSLKAVLATIEAETEDRMRQLRAESEARVQAILQVAITQAEKRCQEWVAQREQEAYDQSARLLRHAQHEANLSRNRAQNQVLEMALESVRDILPALRTQPTYAEVLRHLVLEAIEALKPTLEADEIPRLEADPRDEVLLTMLVATPELSEQIGRLTLHYVLTCDGGINLTSKDGCIVVRNTVESRFEAAIPYLRQYLANALETQTGTV